MLTVRQSIYPIAFRQSRVPAVDLVSDPPTQLSTPSRGAEPSSESPASLTLVICWTYCMEQSSTPSSAY